MKFWNPRLAKEFRALRSTWLGVLWLCFLPVLFGWLKIPQGELRAAATYGFCIGVVLLSALPFGVEFENETMIPLLSMPIPRTKIWTDKFMATAAALISVTAFYAVTWNAATVFLPLMWMMIAGCSGVFCVLVMRSTVGGMLLNLVNTFYASTVVLRAGSASASVTIVAAWCGVMLAAGIWRLKRYQAVRGLGRNDLLVTIPSIPLLRCRPGAATLNFLRKEIHALRPLWAIGVVFGLTYWTLFRLEDAPDLSWRQMVVVRVYQVLSVLLAGSLSLGEDSISGMHPWHLTLPMSRFRQWLIRWCVAVSAALVCGLIVPALVLGAHHPDLTNLPFGLNLNSLFNVVALTTLVFWSACAVKGTVRAVGLSVIVAAIMTSTMRYGHWTRHFMHRPSLDPLEMLMIILFVGLIQSFRLFRRPSQDRPATLAANVAFLVIVAFVLTVV